MSNPIMETLTVGGNTYDVQDARVGDLSNLNTTDKSSLVGAINEAAQSGGGGGTSDYSQLSNKPSINGVTLSGNKTTSDLGITIPSAQSSGTPAALGTAARGTATTYSRSDHVHAKPTAADIGAIAAPSSPATGAFLVWNGSAWAAQTLSAWQGGNY